ncbi:MAG: Tfp pilus assembly protein PilV, partial [Moritella dasanensis]
MHLRHNTLQQGGCLLEVMICLFMLTTAIFGITGLKLTQAQIVLQQSQYTTAWALMEYKLNELRYLTDSINGFTSLSTNVGGNM